MIYGLYQSAGGLQLNQYRLEVLANNLANASTPGFKHDLTLVRERPVETRERPGDPGLRHRTLDGLTGGSLVAPTVTSFEQGALERTGGPLDAALVGDGFFTVQDGQEVRYTRDGRFEVNAEGRLVTAAGGLPVLSDEGVPIEVPAEASGPLRLDADGSLRAGSVRVARIGVVDVDDRSRLVKLGGGLLKAEGTETRPARAAVRPGFIESSTVDPAGAMVSMIEVSRAYQMNATMIGLADATLARAVNDIARLR